MSLKYQDSSESFTQHFIQSVVFDVVLTEQEWLKLVWTVILDVKWYDFVTNESICTTTGLADIRDVVRWRRLGLFGHVARFDHDVPAASVLRLQGLHTNILDVEATSGASTTLVATSSLQGHWHVGHWCSDTVTGPRFVESSRYGLRAKRTMMMMMPVLLFGSFVVWIECQRPKFDSVCTKCIFTFINQNPKFKEMTEKAISYHI